MNDWQQRFAALKALGSASLEMRKPGDWYVHLSGAEIKRGAILYSGLTRSKIASCPAEAVDQAFEEFASQVVVIHAMDRARRRLVRWNGFMWEDVPDDATAPD